MENPFELILERLDRMEKAAVKKNKRYIIKFVKSTRQSLDRQWKMKQEKLFPCFTTRINEIININM